MSNGYKSAVKFSSPPSPYLSSPRKNSMTQSRGSGTPPGASAGRLTAGLKIQNSVPYSHPPLPEEPSGLYDLLITDSDMALSKKKFLKVSSIGQVEVEPNRVEFCILIKTSRTDPVQAKESIKKREDYIMATLKKCRVSEKDIKCTEIVKRIEAEDEDNNECDQQNKGRNKQVNADINANVKNLDPYQPGGLCWRREICITCESLIKYMQIYSVCMEKLDRNVVISQPVVRFSPEHMQIFTHKAMKLAMDNAVLNAKELLGSMKRRALLGRLYYSVQDSLSIQRIEEYDNTNIMSSQFESFNWRKRNKIISCNLTSVFELDYPKLNKPRSAV